MIQSLSSRFQKQVALFILLIFYANVTLAGRGYLFSPGEPGSQGYSELVPPLTSKHPVLTTMEMNQGIGQRSGGAVTLNTIKEEPIRENEKPVNEEPEDIGGPGQPEMTAFKAVGANNMVDLFSGDFSYNIPLGDVGGYPINIFYNSGITMDQEASWVGLGWNINPGTIMRNMRGVPDDFNGDDKVTKEMNIKPQITVG